MRKTYDAALALWLALKVPCATKVVRPFSSLLITLAGTLLNFMKTLCVPVQWSHQPVGLGPLHSLSSGNKYPLSAAAKRVRLEFDHGPSSYIQMSSLA